MPCTSALKSIWLAGSTCDSDDKYTAGGSYILMPKLKEGEKQYVAILDTGAYQDGLSFSSLFVAIAGKIDCSGWHN